MRPWVQHRYPYPQRILYDFNLNPMDATFYEQSEQADNDVTFGFRNTRTPMNILVKYDPDLFP